MIDPPLPGLRLRACHCSSQRVGLSTPRTGALLTFQAHMDEPSTTRTQETLARLSQTVSVAYCKIVALLIVAEE